MPDPNATEPSKVLEYGGWAAFLTTTVAGLWFKKLLRTVEGFPALRLKLAEVDKFATTTDAKLDDHLKEVERYKEAIAVDLARLNARQEAYERGQNRIIEALQTLTRAIDDGRKEVTARIDNIVDRRQER